MRHHTKNRGLLVLVRREGDGNDSPFRWGIYRRRIPFGVKLSEGGFGSYVKPYKPYFIGRDAYVAREKERKGVVIRFTFDEQRVRMAHNNDPVVSADGKRIGFVTSCAIDGQRFITGQAFVDLAYAKEGTPIAIYQGGVMDRPATAAKVVSRFAKL